MRINGVDLISPNRETRPALLSSIHIQRYVSVIQIFSTLAFLSSVANEMMDDIVGHFLLSELKPELDSGLDRVLETHCLPLSEILLKCRRNLRYMSSDCRQLCPEYDKITTSLLKSYSPS